MQCSSTPEGTPVFFAFWQNTNAVTEQIFNFLCGSHLESFFQIVQDSFWGPGMQGSTEFGRRACVHACMCACVYAFGVGASGRNELPHACVREGSPTTTHPPPREGPCGRGRGSPAATPLGPLPWSSDRTSSWRTAEATQSVSWRTSTGGQGRGAWGFSGNADPEICTRTPAGRAKVVCWSCDRHRGSTPECSPRERAGSSEISPGLPRPSTRLHGGLAGDIRTGKWLDGLRDPRLLRRESPRRRSSLDKSPRPSHAFRQNYKAGHGHSQINCSKLAPEHVEASSLFFRSRTCISHIYKSTRRGTQNLWPFARSFDSKFRQNFAIVLSHRSRHCSSQACLPKAQQVCFPEQEVGYANKNDEGCLHAWVTRSNWKCPKVTLEIQLAYHQWNRRQLCADDVEQTVP